MNILVTGGASGLGESITRLLAQEKGEKVFFTYHRSGVKAKKLQDSLEQAVGIACDFSRQEDIDSLMRRMESMDLDVLVNNAVTGLTKMHFHKAPGDIFLQSFRLNVYPVVLITQQAIRLFRKKKSGKIITILTSALINKPPVGWSEYTANKAYLFSLSKSWAAENISFNITSNCISPSFMRTPLHRDMDDRLIEVMAGTHPLKKLLTVDEVAQEVWHLIQASAHLNGANIVLNAGADII